MIKGVCGCVEGRGGEGRYIDIDSDIIIDEHHHRRTSSSSIIIINTWRTRAYRFVLFFWHVFSERAKQGFGMEMEWTGNLEWSGKREKVDWKWNGVEKAKRTKVNWEDEWIMIPPTLLKPPVACDDWP